MSETSWLDYFSGGVPTLEFFHITLEEVRELSEGDKAPDGYINRLQELCFIGLLSYFEAFCKDHFASLINIEPPLVMNLKTGGQDVQVDSRHVIICGEAVKQRIGFVLAEKYDFGTSKKTNALFLALLKVTPFNKSGAKRYDDLLRDRNLLVHHGGVFTFAYLEQTSLHPSNLNLQSDAFTNSRIVGRAEVIAAVEFIENVADKLVRGSHAALVRYLEANNIQYSGERKKALDLISYSRKTGDDAAK